MHDVTEQRVKPPSRGLLRPGRYLWVRALAWCIVLALVLWGAYKFVRGVGIGLGLGGTGIPTASGALVALALYVLGAPDRAAETGRARARPARA